MQKARSYTQEEIDALKTGGVFDHCIFDSRVIKNRQLQESTFTNCSFVKCDLTGTKFNNTKFNTCNFSNANVAGCNFFSAVFIECKLLGVVFSRANSLIGVTFTQCNFDYADLRGIDLSGLDLSKSSFFETDLSMANLEKTLFVNCHVTNIKVQKARLHMTDFRGAELLGFNLRSDDLKGIIVTPQQMEQLATAVGIHVIE